MTRPVRRTLSVLLAALVAVLAASCTGGAAQPPRATASATSSPSMTSPTPTSTPTAGPEDEAAARAEEALRAYLRSQTECLSDPPNTPDTCFDAVAIGTELVNRKNALTTARAMATRVSGELVLDSIERRSVDLTTMPEATPPVVPTVMFGACVDVSHYVAVDKDGKSIVQPGRPTTSPLAISVYNYQLPDPTAWRVGYVEPAKDLACGG